MPDAPAAPTAEPTAPVVPSAPPAETTTRRAPDHSFTDGSYSEEIYLRRKPEAPVAEPPKSPEGETTPEGETPAAPEPTIPEEKPLTGEQLNDLSDEDFLSYLEKHPKGKERLERLRQNWKGNAEQEVRSRVQRELAEERRKEVEADKAYSEYAKLAQEKPEVWDALTTEGSPAFNKQVVEFVQQYEAWQKVRGKESVADPKPVDVQKLSAELLDDWNERGWKDVKASLKTEVPYWDKLDKGFRDMVEEDKVGGDGGWWKATLTGLVKSMDSYYKKQLQEAREAGRNEALAEEGDSGPVQPATTNGKAVTEMNDREILAEYAAGSRRVSREQYHAAAKRLKLE